MKDDDCHQLFALFKTVYLNVCACIFSFIDRVYRKHIFSLIWQLCDGGMLVLIGPFYVIVSVEKLFSRNLAVALSSKCYILSTRISIKSNLAGANQKDSIVSFFEYQKQTKYFPHFIIEKKTIEVFFYAFSILKIVSCSLSLQPPQFFRFLN